MTFYKSIPIVVEAHRFDGSGASGMAILEWAVKHGVKNPWLYCDDPNQPAQLDLRIPHVKIAEIGDYVVRILDIHQRVKTGFRVFTEEQFKSMYEAACPTCSGQIRETTNLVCQTCGHDYSKGI
jgi:hypothetical protein